MHGCMSDQVLGVDLFSVVGAGGCCVRGFGEGGERAASLAGSQGASKGAHAVWAGWIHDA